MTNENPTFTEQRTEFTEQRTEIKRRHTQQKKLVLDTLVSLGSHVSASAVFRELQKTHPYIGRATAFRVLSNLAEDGELLRLSFAGSDDRFDITTRPHRHSICRSCGLVEDIDPDGLTLPEAGSTTESGFRLETVHIEFVGLCAECAKKEDAEKADEYPKNS